MQLLSESANNHFIFLDQLNLSYQFWASWVCWGLRAFQWIFLHLLATKAPMWAGVSYNPTLKPVQGLYRGRVISESCPICGGWWISPCSAPSAQWGEGKADKVIYLHLSTSCNGWHIHLFLKLHHLTAAPPLLHAEVGEREMKHFREEKKGENRQTGMWVLLQILSLRLKVCGNMTLSTQKLLNPSTVSGRNKTLDRSQL